MKEGIVQQSLAGFYDVLSDGKLYRTRGRGNLRKRGIKPMVGDHVEFDAPNDREGYLLEVLARKNSLVRPPIANVDLALVVTAVREPIFSTNLLDRQLVALEVQNITPIIYFSKTDLLSEQEFEKLQVAADGYRQIGYQVFYQRDPFADEQLKQLQAELVGNISVVMGQTGAGKSTLLNHIAPQLELETGEISQALQRGKHTTRKVSLLNIDGCLIADTPGFSSYEAFEMDATELPRYFPEFLELSVNCRFRGCLHLKEPGCAVKAALENGTILASRYKSYEQFNELIVQQKPNYKK
ncbi:ribosome small subunit-dependent GTPase A [Paucilactobacillus oligofermentans DSM 15707 = LMG 22743]|uniref:Small ribosomal subunit biogenesis GTPase RsgA n=1 Tax=Paucilactobacillus oligofermentans DSM 15707 = LMG 22743 TaxID=1423778 RepID=A0A0R1RN50_9LACO|nr:ribosome small subunit-dependent GTPase A [Paucilactobacillus oligofermentans]KRL54907.1 ribosome small subunit-dependent GTPase A [Paucilactobacillus oligofermentans DSM 15707 = LMG 22743]CUS26178.1 Putative ribosome biogenesis GTPase YloQ [Paucilactobacillus oligofermentans DSM 15707 = LMG 22743]